VNSTLSRPTAATAHGSRLDDIHFLLFRRPLPLPWPLPLPTPFSVTAGLDFDDEESPFDFLTAFFAYKTNE